MGLDVRRWIVAAGLLALLPGAAGCVRIRSKEERAAPRAQAWVPLAPAGADRDGDGVLDALDPCPDAAAPGGCPGAGPARHVASGSGGAGFTLEARSFPVGAPIAVTYDQALQPPSGQQYWITLAPAGSPDSTWGEWHYVASGARADVLRGKAPGRYEVRLHDLYPRREYGVIARLAVELR